MERSFEAVLVEQCATTLAGVKPASLFRYQGATSGSPGRPRPLGQRAGPYGITIRVLKYCPQTGACLIYLVPGRDGFGRSSRSHPPRAFLAGQGYGADQSCQELLRQLSRRLCLEREFPHEIGVFLGYPLEDVVGFIRNRGRNYTCCGYWKAYGDRRRHKSVSINTAAALPPAVSSSGRARPSRS